jgi:non-ribosomal peptide synthetase component F/acyl carrier protein
MHDDAAGSIAVRVQAAWTAVLADRVDGPVDEHQAFVSAGGHSLAAARLIARLRSDLDVELPMAAILRDDPTLAELVVAVTKRLAAEPHAVEPHAVASGEQPAADAPSTTAPTTAPVGPTLRRIWTWHRLHPDSPAYNVVRVLSIAGRVQPAVLRAALVDLTGRHEALRCAVVEPRPGQPEVVLSEDVTVPLSVEVVRAAGDDPTAAVDEALYRIADKPFAMTAPPLWRVGVVYAPALDRSFLILVMHHIISDLRTTDLVLTELAAAYTARAAGAQPRFDTAAPSLLAHLIHEAGLVGTPRWEDDLAWWSSRLSGVSASAPLPLSAAERDEQEFAATTHTVELSAAESDSLDDALRARGLTPALFFLATASSVVAAWSGQDRAEVIGLPSVRTSRPEDERLVGFLLDTLPLPVAPARDLPFLRTYDALRDAYFDAADHARPAFDDVVDRLRLPRTNRSPLIRLWFSDLTQEVTPPTFGDQAVVEYDLPPTWSLFDLGLYLCRSRAGYRLHLVSPHGLVEPADTAALLWQIARAATRAAVDPTRPIGELLEAPDDADHAASTVDGRATVDLVWYHAVNRPTATAVLDLDGALDYRSLAHQVDAASAELEPAAVVAVPARRDRLFVIRLLACWRAGATAVVVDADWPQWRRRRAFEIAGVSRAYPWSGDGPAEPVDIDVAPQDPDGPAHVLFTSGTTGDPLAVRVATPVAENGLAQLADLLDMGAADRVSMLSGPAHDPVLRDVGLALRAGATVCIPPAEVFGGPGRLATWLRQERITVVNATPALLSLILGADPQPLPDVRAVVCGGSPLSAATAALIRSRALNATIINGYGCTETPQVVIAHRIAADEPVPPTAQVPVGRPLPGRRVELRALDGRRCDTGQLGEVWVAQPHIAQGYLGPVGRVERFVTDQDGVRWLRTGDLARRDAAGRVHLAGRTDRQVLVYGYRVMLEELESVARACAGVADALAQVVDDGSRQAIRVWVQRSPGVAVAEDAVRRHLAAVLPASIVPARVLVVDQLDVSDTLKPVAPDREPLADRAVPADAAHERRVRELAESVLGRALDPTTNFFDAGFTSVSLLQLSAELSDLLGRPVEALSLFHHPNLHALSADLFGEPDDGSTLTEPPPSVADRAERLARMQASRRQVRRWIQESAVGSDSAG